MKYEELRNLREAHESKSREVSNCVLISKIDAQELAEDIEVFLFITKPEGQKLEVKTGCTIAGLTIYVCYAEKGFVQFFRLCREAKNV